MHSVPGGGADRAGVDRELSCAALGASVAAYDPAGVEVVDEVGELVLTKPMPSMPVSFWNDPDGSRLRAAYFDHYPGVWRHGDWVRRTPRGSYVIYGRSDSTLNRGGVRMGTADFYAVVEGRAGPRLTRHRYQRARRRDRRRAVCFLVLAPGATLAEVELQLRQALRTELSPRHVPDRFVVVQEIPRTLNGKKCEVPVKRILAGVDPDQAVSRDALQNPDRWPPSSRWLVADLAPSASDDQAANRACASRSAVVGQKTFVAARQRAVVAAWGHPRSLGHRLHDLAQRVGSRTSRLPAQLSANTAAVQRRQRQKHLEQRLVRG